MFESIMVRRTAPMGAEGTVDLGHLAESMIFYQKVHLMLNRNNLDQFILGTGPDLAIELVESNGIDAVYFDRNFTVLNEDIGTPRERHRPASFRIMHKDGVGEQSTIRPETYQDVIYEMFGKAIDSKRKARRKANRFINQLRAYDMPDDISDMAAGDWQREDFIREAIVKVIADLVPSYTPPKDLHAALVKVDDRYYRFESNLDWAALRAAHAAKIGQESNLGPGELLIALVDMTGDLYLGAAFNATLALDPLGAQLLQTKCSDLRTAAAMQQSQIDQFQNLVVRGLKDVRGAVNSGARSFQDFLKVQNQAQSFRDWLDGQSPDANLVKSYSNEAAKKHGLEGSSAHELRWMLPTAGDAATVAGTMAHILAPGPAIAIAATSGTLHILDRFVIERYMIGWRPSSFIDKKLKPFVNC